MRKLRIANLILLLCLALTFPVSAAEAGSLALCNVKSPAVLYRVADEMGTATQAFSSVLTETLTENALTPELARQLQTYAKGQEIPGQTGTPDNSGQISFSILEEGCYLVCSTAEKGEFAPFLIRVPMTIGDKLVYDIQATPKSEIPNDPNAPGKPVDPQPNIPQTGNIQWPKYLLLVLGGAAIIAGFAEVLRGREKTYE